MKLLIIGFLLGVLAVVVVILYCAVLLGHSTDTRPESRPADKEEHTCIM